MVKGIYDTGLFDLKEEFVTAVDIAEVAYKEGNHTKAAYWIGQATVYAHLYGESTDEPLKDEVGFKHYRTWVLLRWASAN